jgi:hypothetical protein
VCIKPCDVHVHIFIVYGHTEAFHHKANERAFDIIKKNQAAHILLTIHSDILNMVH